ncbi:sterol desaturase family protein [Agrobacterium vitis]|uniref:Sterol desaturase family protein n=1 Tax=Agrobacterium vitis TaxID=373 RepID=A0A7K1REI9_AGRVI|nr:sterol desaturase family protein [Agrobacterium vitis]MVA56419.1 sterol desaturase family protein [Agrobacterium vitis]
MKILASFLVWPGVFVFGLTGSYFAFSSPHPLLGFVAVYLCAFGLLALSERFLPYEPTWLEGDGETVNDVAHTLLTKGLVEFLSGLTVIFPMAAARVLQPLTALEFHLWPTGLPMVLQVVLGLIVAEFGLYWAHRIAHERLFFWRFHALHHSVTRLWVVNTGRFHVMDSLFKVALSQLPLYLLGAPVAVFLWVGAATAFIGILTHCNVAVRTGILDLVFSTPRLHRWHHSKILREGNTNYGENLVLFDQIFGTYYNPEHGPSTNIGISGTVAKGFVGQLVQPFTLKGQRQILGARPVEEGALAPPDVIAQNSRSTSNLSTDSAPPPKAA